ncbi:MAG: CoA-binding protein [Saprospiraceae bacterium]
MKKTLVLGASNNPTRYSFAAVRRLKQMGIEVVPISNKKGEVEGIPILNGKPEVENIHTVTLYLNPQRQEEYYDYILSLKPDRIIFNPGTENPILMKKAKEAGIEPIIGCSLVMMATGEF